MTETETETAERAEESDPISLLPRLWPSGKTVLSDGRTAMLRVGERGIFAELEDGHVRRLRRDRLWPIPRAA